MIHRIAMTAAIVASAALIATTPASAKIEWDLASVFAPTSADGVAATYFAEQVAKKTNGEIEITVHFSGALGYKCPDLIDVVETGAVPLASICTTMLGGIDPLFLASTLPFVMEKATHARVYRDVYTPYLEKVWEKHNQKILYSYPNTPAGLWAKEEKTTPDSLKNWKMRTFDINSLSTMTNAGAAAINLPWTDVIPALSTGTITGVLTASDAGFTSHFNDFLPYFIAVNAAIGIADCTISLDAFNELSPDLQKAVVEAGNETNDFAFTRMEGLVSETYDNMRAAGMTVIENPPAELMNFLKKAGGPVVDDWLAKTGANGKAIFDEYGRRLAAIK